MDQQSAIANLSRTVMTKILQFFDLTVHSKAYNTSVGSLFESYVKLTISVSKWKARRAAIKELESRSKAINTAFEQNMFLQVCMKNFMLNFASIMRI